MATTNKRQILIDVIGDFSKYQSGAKNASGATQSFQDRIEQAGKAIALAYGAKQVWDWSAAAVRAATEDAAAQAVLATALRNTTGATDAQIESIEDWITSTSHATGILDDDLRPAMAKLLGATKDQAAAQDLLALAMDVSRGTGKELSVVTDAIGKAYAGNTTALGRLVPGIKLAGEGTLSWATAQQRLNDQFKGQAAAFAETAEGKLQRLNAQYQDMQETIGQALMPVMEQLVGYVADLLGWFNSLDGDTQQLIVTLGLAAGGMYIAVTAAAALKTAVATLGVTAQSTMPWLAAIGGVAALLVGVTGGLGSQNAELEQRTHEVSDALATETARVIELHRATSDASSGVGDLELAQVALSRALTGMDSTGVKTAESLGALGFQAEEAAELLVLLKESGVEQLEEGLGLGNGEIIETVKQMFILQGHTEDVAAVLAEAATGASIMGDAADVTKDKTAGWTEAQKEAFKAAEELGRIAGDTDVAGVARVFLNAEVATNEFREQLVATAEAQSGASRNGAEAALVYETYLGLLTELTPEQIALYDATELTTAAVEESVTAMSAQKVAADRVSESLQDTRVELEGAAEAASALKAALDEVFGPTMSLEEANRKLLDRVEATTQSILEHGRTLDVNTEAGRQNRSAIQAQAEAIFEQGAAMVEAGASTEEASAAMETQLEHLEDQLLMLGLNEEEVRAYIEALGLTPENVTTSVELAQAEATKRQLKDLLEQMGDIDEGAKAEILADIDEGRFNAAASSINELAADRDMEVRVRVTGGGQVSVSTPAGTGGSWLVRAYAKGGVADGLALVGEEGPELVNFTHPGRVIPADETSSILSRAGGAGQAPVVIHIEVHGSVTTERQLHETIQHAIREASRREGRSVVAPRRVPI